MYCYGHGYTPSSLRWETSFLLSLTLPPVPQFFWRLQMPLGLSVGGALGDPSPSHPFRPSRYVPVSAATVFLVGATTLFLCFTWVEPKYIEIEIESISIAVSVHSFHISPMWGISVQMSLAVRAVLLLHSALYCCGLPLHTGQFLYGHIHGPWHLS